MWSVVLVGRLETFEVEKTISMRMKNTKTRKSITRSDFVQLSADCSVCRNCCITKVHTAVNSVKIVWRTVEWRIVQHHFSLSFNHRDTINHTYMHNFHVYMHTEYIRTPNTLYKINITHLTHSLSLLLSFGYVYVYTKILGKWNYIHLECIVAISHTVSLLSFFSLAFQYFRPFKW